MSLLTSDSNKVFFSLSNIFSASRNPAFIQALFLSADFPKDLLFQILCQCAQSCRFPILPGTVYCKILTCIDHLFYLFQTIRYIYHVISQLPLSFGFIAYCLLCLPASNMSTAAATAAFSDSARPCMGMRTRQSAHSATSPLRPFPSFPMRNAVPPE